MVLPVRVALFDRATGAKQAERLVAQGMIHRMAEPEETAAAILDLHREHRLKFIAS